MDLNLDAGERAEAIEDGREAMLVSLVSSVNIACGGHAGDEATMTASLALASRLGVACGAHPGYPDRAGFGRSRCDLPPAEIAATVTQQVDALAEIASRLGLQLSHIKPHGALYNDAARDPVLAGAVAHGALPWRAHAVLVGLAGAPCLEIYRQAGFAVLAEAFVERRYDPDGNLRARHHADAVIDDPQAAAEQALDIALHGKVRAVDGSILTVRADTLCLHSDSPHAVDVARAVREALIAAGIQIRACERSRAAGPCRPGSVTVRCR